MRPSVTRAALWLALAGLLWVLGGQVVGADAPALGGCQLLPPDNIWNVRVDHLPVLADSDAYIASIGREGHLHPDFGAGLYEGRPIGIPYCTVSGDQPGVTVTFQYDDESDGGLYPIPPNPPIEGGASSTGDRHILIVDLDHCRLYELYAAYPQDDGTWRAGSGAVYDLSSHGLRPAGWTSADAAGLPILPGLVRYEEVQAGAIEHALRFTAEHTRRAYVWPARHFASSSDDPDWPPMGLRLRLKADFDVTPFPEQARVILLALQRYGMILADNGGDWYISGVPDARWDNDLLGEALRAVPGSSFEAVDTASLMLDADSGQVRATVQPHLVLLPLIWRSR